MKLQITKELINSIYSAKFELIDLTEFDTDLLADYETTTFLNVGGDITTTEMVDDGAGGTKEEVVVLLAQGDKYINFVSEMPVAKAWSIAQYGVKTEAIAIAGTKNLEDRITTLIGELKAKQDKFSGIEQILL